MSTLSLDRIRSEPIVTAAAAIAVIGLATILGAYFFQYVLGYRPCPLCLEQRYAYYAAIPLAALVLLGVSVGSSRKVMLLAFLAIAVAMLWNTGLAAYHSGVEWQWWEGPKDCSGPVSELRSGRRAARPDPEHPRDPLRRGGVALPRPVARRLQRADLAGARRDRGVGRARRVSDVEERTGGGLIRYGSSSVSQ